MKKRLRSKGRAEACSRPPRPPCPPSPAELCPPHVLEHIFALLDQPALLAASTTCRSWFEASLSPALHHSVSFVNPRLERKVFSRLQGFALWAQRRAAGIRRLSLTVRVTKDRHLPAMKLARRAVLAAAGDSGLEHLELVANYSFPLADQLAEPSLAVALSSLQSLSLHSAQGHLTLAGDLSSWRQLTRLHTSSHKPVTVSPSTRLPPCIQQLHLGNIRDNLPLQLTQLSSSLQQLTVSGSQLSEGLNGMEYDDALPALTHLTSLHLENQDGDDFLPPESISAITGLRQLSISGNACWRWRLLGGFELLSEGLAGSAQVLSYLDLSCCQLEGVPPVLAQLSALRLLLLHDNSFTLSDQTTEGWLPRLRTLSLDWMALVHATDPQLIQRATSLQRLALLGMGGNHQLARALRFMPWLDLLVVEQGVGTHYRPLNTPFGLDSDLYWVPCRFEGIPNVVEITRDKAGRQQALRLELGLHELGGDAGT